MSNKLIQQELAYFKPMLARDKLSSVETREKWRLETIRERQKRISLEVYDMCNGIVQYGPFKGMILNRQTWWGELDLGAQCLGLYEYEILSLLSQRKDKQFDTFIDIGAADGYYAVGMLFSNLVSSVICFEASANGQQAIKNNWQKNGSPGELHIHGVADNITIQSIPDEALNNALIMIDIEGHEFELLDASFLDKLKHSEILIEIHNWVENFEVKYESLLKRLMQYFDISIVERVERPTTSRPELISFTDDNRLLLVSERRPCLMRFLHLTPLAK